MSSWELACLRLAISCVVTSYMSGCSDEQRWCWMTRVTQRDPLRPEPHVTCIDIGIAIAIVLQRFTALCWTKIITILLQIPA